MELLIALLFYNELYLIVRVEEAVSISILRLVTDFFTPFLWKEDDDMTFNENVNSSQNDFRYNYFCGYPQVLVSFLVASKRNMLNFMQREN